MPRTSPFQIIQIESNQMLRKVWSIMKLYPCNGIHRMNKLNSYATWINYTTIMMKETRHKAHIVPFCLHKNQKHRHSFNVQRDREISMVQTKRSMENLEAYRRL